MAETDEEAVATADDALYVLTAILLTPAQFPSVLGDDYPEACAALGLAPLADGYGLVLGQDGDGARWTVVIDDVSLVAVAIASWDCGMEYDLSPEEHTVVAALPGWPLAVAVAAPDVPAPHDPGPELTDRPPLAPPDTAVVGPGAATSRRRRDRAPVGGLAGAAQRRGLHPSGWQVSGARGRAGRGRVGHGSGCGRHRPGRGRRDPGRGTPPGRGHREPPLPAFGASSRRYARTWRLLRLSAVSAPPSLRVTRGHCAPTVPAGRWWPGPTTSPSSCSTTSPERYCRWAGARSCPVSSKRSTRWPYAPAEPRRPTPPGSLWFLPGGVRHAEVLRRPPGVSAGVRHARHRMAPPQRPISLRVTRRSLRRCAGSSAR